jgi:D-glycerate 3-kinase
MLKRFLMHYERISRHALGALPSRADVVVALDAARRVVRIRARSRRDAQKAPPRYRS